MTDREIAERLHSYLLQSCARGQFGLLQNFLREPIEFDSAKTNRIRDWYRSLSPAEMDVVSDLMDECAEMCLFSIAVVLDGAVKLEENTRLELSVIDRDGARIVASARRDPKGDYFHDLVGDVIRNKSVSIGNEKGDSKDGNLC